MTYIYALKDPNTGRYVYVGKTHDPKQRLILHTHGTHGTELRQWVRNLRLSGHRPEMVILQTLDSNQATPMVAEEEIEWASKFAEEGHPILNQQGMPESLRYPRFNLPKRIVAVMQEPRARLNTAIYKRTHDRLVRISQAMGKAKPMIEIIDEAILAYEQSQIAEKGE